MNKDEEGETSESSESFEVNQAEEGIKGGEVVEDFFHYQLESVPFLQPKKIHIS